MNTRTMAFQIDEALFQRIKTHLARTGQSQKAFVIGLIEQALSEAEDGNTVQEDTSDSDGSGRPDEDTSPEANHTEPDEDIAPEDGDTPE